jgi:hypothetical protein
VNCKTCQHVIVPDFLSRFAFSCTLHLLHNQIKSATLETSPNSRHRSLFITMVPSRISRPQYVITMVRDTRLSKALTVGRRVAEKLSKVTPPKRDVHLPILKLSVALLKEWREKVMEGGQKGHGILKWLIEEHIQHFPWLTRNMLNHYIITYTDDNIVSLDIVTGTNTQTVVSGLNDGSPIYMATMITTPTVITTTMQESESVSTSKRGIITTARKKSANDRRKSLVVDDVGECAIQTTSLNTMVLHNTHKCGNGTKYCVHWGTFEEVVQKVCDKYNFKRSKIQMKISMSRNKSGRKLRVNHWGTQ